MLMMMGVAWLIVVKIFSVRIISDTGEANEQFRFYRKQGMLEASQVQIGRL